MTDLTDLEPGCTVLIRAVLEALDGDTALVTVAGPRPPFTAVALQVGEDDIEGLASERPEPDKPLEPGDHVRNSQGREYEVVTGLKETEDGTVMVALWSEQAGFDFDYPQNLELVQD